MGTVVVADEQTRGRGRLGRPWSTPPASGLAVSFVVRPVELLSLRAGVAAAEAGGPDLRLKWPNDLLLKGLKVGGILVEVSAQQALVGIGVNLAWAPPGAGRLEADRDALLARLLPALASWLERPAPAVLDRWRALSATLGERVRVELPAERLEGIAEDIAPDGALIVSGRRVSAGDVVLLRPAGETP